MAKGNSWPFPNGQIIDLAVSKRPSHFQTLQRYQNGHGRFKTAKGFETASNISTINDLLFINRCQNNPF